MLHVSTGTVLAVWLKEEGLTLSSIGLISLLKLPYIFKFLWAPFLDYLSNKYLHIDIRKIMLSCCLIACSLSLYFLSLVSPKHSPALFVTLILIISLFSSIYDVLMHVLQMLGLKPLNWGYGEAAGVSGFRCGMLFAGAGALYFSTLTSWQEIFKAISFVILLPFLLIWHTPALSLQTATSQTPSRFNFKDSLSAPFQDFFQKPKWQWIILLMIFYRMQDYIKGSMLTLFYLEHGYTKETLSIAYKAFGFVMASFGGIIGGYLLRTKGYRFALLIGLIAHSASGFVFFLPSFKSANIYILYLGIFVHEVSKGMAIAPFFSYQLFSASQKFAISQIAILTSVTTLAHSIFGSFSGYIAQNFGWNIFLSISIISSIPAIFILRRIP